MKCSRKEILVLPIIWLFCFHVLEISSKSVKIRTAKPKINSATHHGIHYPGVKVHRPLPLHPSIITSQTRNAIHRQSGALALEPSNDISQDPIQNIFNTGFRGAFEYLQKLVSGYINTNEGNESIDENENNLRIPGLPTTPIFHHLDVSSIVKLFEATDGSQVEILAEAAVVDIVSQLVNIIGFNDLRDWLGIVLMYFILGPILIPLFWLPISLFGMAGLLVPLFFFNPPSKLNTDVLGHDPILPEKEEERKLPQDKISDISIDNILQNMFKTSSVLKQFSLPLLPASGFVESCMERVSCHLTRLYRDNLVSKWLTSHFNVTKVEWARRLPEGDINGNGISSWEDCKKYVCSVFPAA